MLPIKVREIKATDIDDVVALERRYFDQPITGKHLRYEVFENLMAHQFVAEVDGKILGYVGCWLTGENIDIMNIVVDETVRRQGVGRFLLFHLIDFGLKHDCLHVSLEVRESNQAAIKLYASLGFEVVRKRVNYYKNGEDALYMVKVLGGSK